MCCAALCTSIVFGALAEPAPQACTKPSLACSLNGCHANTASAPVACRCTPPWTGPTCASLRFTPSTYASGYGRPYGNT